MRKTIMDLAYISLVIMMIWRFAGVEIRRALATSTRLLRIGVKSPQFALGYRFGYIAGGIAAAERAGKNVGA